ncbi:beta-1,3-glucan recognition protein 1 [Nomia melanderi]|uniref:beta-1,3-glucan recognition protein 1 n=1 Tax=Nomia melanderi TaxID=2448451 RepID=UPI001304788C|nr:beta-1,3-glucan-binding protein 1-like [Nomia melanderi]
MNAHLVKSLFFVSVFNLFHDNFAQYVPPTPTIEPLLPKGLRISIPHEDGISLVAYHVKFNEDFYSLEAGTIAVDIIKTKNGRWTYEDRRTKLKPGDVIYLWVHVVYEGLGYNLLDQQHVVDKFYNYDGTQAGGGTPGGTCTANSETRMYIRDKETQELKRSNVCAGQLIFEENFDSLDPNRWKTIERFSPSNYEFVVYMNNEENVYLKDGALHINPTLVKEKFDFTFVQDGTLTLTKCTGQANTNECSRTARAWDILPPVISGRLNTKPSFSFLYGKIEIRAKLPRGDWIYPLLTLENEEISANGTSLCNIIIANSLGNPLLVTTSKRDIGGHLLQGGAHAVNVQGNTAQDNRMQLPTKTLDSLWSDDYHVYELEWGNGYIVLRVDGVQYGEQKVPATYDVPVYINIGLGVAGRVVFPDGSRSGNVLKPWKNLGVKAMYDFYTADSDWLQTWKQGDVQLLVDYIKVHAL